MANSPTRMRAMMSNTALKAKVCVRFGSEADLLKRDRQSTETAGLGVDERKVGRGGSGWKYWIDLPS